MKNVKQKSAVNVAAMFGDFSSAPSYQVKHGWKLETRFKEIPKGESLTVPDDSYTIRDLIKKYASGLDPGVTKLANHNGEEDEVDFDDVDFASEARQDIADVYEQLRRQAERQKTLLQQMEERKKAASEMPTLKEDSDDAEERPEEENTRKSRKYERPKKSDEGASD